MSVDASTRSSSQCVQASTRLIGDPPQSGHSADRVDTLVRAAYQNPIMQSTCTRDRTARDVFLRRLRVRSQVRIIYIM